MCGTIKKITKEEWEKIYENFDSHEILEAVDHIDHARSYLSDGGNLRPPEIRTELLKMHSTAMNIVRHGNKDKETLREFFDTANDLSMQLYDLIEELEKVQKILDNLLEQYPDSLNLD